IVRSMEYQFPGHGYENLNTQFMLGDDILVAPVVEKGEQVKTVYLPEGDWKEQNDGTVYHGGCAVSVPAPVDRLPWFRRV
ncbi:MAG: glycoside hydrolase, partial [Eubacteriales bacterium]